MFLDILFVMLIINIEWINIDVISGIGYSYWLNVLRSDIGFNELGN